MLPKNAKKVEGNKLALGESTGHFHAAIALDAEVYDVGESRFLAAPSGTDVTHQEHGTIKLPPGDYERTIVQEYDYDLEESKNVVD